MTGIVTPGSIAPVRARMRALAERRFAASRDVPTRFFETNADAISRACLEMARRFQRGGRLLVLGDGAATTDAQHVAVEFVHPIIVGKRALPALSLGSVAAPGSLLTAPVAGGPGFQRTLEILGRESDIALGIAGLSSRSMAGALQSARQMGMLTLALGGEGDHAATSVAELLFTVPSSDPMLIQEVHEMLYHVLWELVHVFLDQGATG